MTMVTASIDVEEEKTADGYVHYHSDLLKLFSCHNNVELSSSGRSCIYINTSAKAPIAQNLKWNMIKSENL